jgi:ribosomal protein S18 acetylase RimI-like enzyme
MIEVSLATPEDRVQIYAIRHQVYARELRQHPDNPEGVLQDALDDINTYVVAKRGGSVVGFVAVTPPATYGYSIDKYFRRDDLPLRFDDGLYEVRLLTVTPSYRHSWLGSLLMYAALRFVESRTRSSPSVVSNCSSCTRGWICDPWASAPRLAR